MKKKKQEPANGRADVLYVKLVNAVRTVVNLSADVSAARNVLITSSGPRNKFQKIDYDAIDELFETGEYAEAHGYVYYLLARYKQQAYLQVLTSSTRSVKVGLMQKLRIKPIDYRW